MMGLNNKGMTIVEILVCFLIVTFISVSLFNTVETFNNKKNVESAKSALLEYRNNIDKMIEDDLVHRGLTNAQITDHHTGGNSYKDVTLFFRDGSVKILRINDQRAGEYYYNLDNETTYTGESAAAKSAACTGKDDLFYIRYGTNVSSPTGDYIEYLLPDVGEYENTECPKANGKPEIIKDIRFGKIEVSAKDNVLVIFIGLTHPDLGNNYSINIVAPMNYYA